MARRSSMSTPSGLRKYNTGSPLPRNATPLNRVGKNPLPHIRLYKACALLSEGNRGVKTMNAGRSLLSLPSPYASHEPKLAFPGTSEPVIT